MRRVEKPRDAGDGEGRGGWRRCRSPLLGMLRQEGEEPRDAGDGVGGGVGEGVEVPCYS